MYNLLHGRFGINLCYVHVRTCHVTYFVYSLLCQCYWCQIQTPTGDIIPLGWKGNMLSSFPFLCPLSPSLFLGLSVPPTLIPHGLREQLAFWMLYPLCEDTLIGSPLCKAEQHGVEAASFSWYCSPSLVEIKKEGKNRGKETIEGLTHHFQKQSHGGHQYSMFTLTLSRCLFPLQPHTLSLYVSPVSQSLALLGPLMRINGALIDFPHVFLSNVNTNALVSSLPPSLPHSLSFWQLDSSV